MKGGTWRCGRAGQTILTSAGLIILLLLAPAAARAWDNLDIPAELRRPGVRLVVVEFYADWCKPCKAAVPLWNELHEQYKDRGLRLLVVSVGDGGTCSNPGWQPDKVVCDFDGKLQTTFGADTLPQAFLYSWQGNLLVKNGHFDAVKRAVDGYFRSSPRILVGEPEHQDGRTILNSAGLRETVRTDLRRLAKFEMVAGDKELASLRELRKKGHELKYDDAGRCQLGREVSANSELRVKLVTMGDEQTLVLQLYSVESGCMLASSKARVGSGGLDGASFEAVGALVEQLIGRSDSNSSRSGSTDNLSYDELMKRAQELEAQKQQLEEAQARRRAEIEAEWRKAQEVASQVALPVKDRIAFVERFLAAFPDGNPFEKDARKLLATLAETVVAFVDFSAFPDGPIEAQNMLATSSANLDKNPHYKKSVRFLTDDATLSLTATVDSTAITGCRLRITHLSSFSKGCRNDGYSPITVTVNGSSVVSEYSPKSHSFVVEDFPIPIPLNEGDNTIIFRSGNICTHYWLQRVELICGQ